MRFCFLIFLGDPSNPKSLHYMGAPHYESAYMKVIKSVGRVLEPYDADGAIAAYGVCVCYTLLTAVHWLIVI